MCILNTIVHVVVVVVPFFLRGLDVERFGSFRVGFIRVLCRGVLVVLLARSGVFFLHAAGRVGALSRHTVQPSCSVLVALRTNDFNVNSFRVAIKKGCFRWNSSICKDCLRSQRINSGLRKGKGLRSMHAEPPV